ncbi:hypothetical protein GCM10007276_02880 [Agaricicola taiwanensis]|uniref:TRAP transporter small permease protein n=1 Tax=Agaricicola taiwanensis TaxID=591372 RepID=A0A8J2VM02_9RHOB|nr:TRAP transporter small permease [Agaricicola taiwanensis]GGE29155.1 hypothetical protein GCM10007276_02880 [Agaricicola taiwanensis]
MQRLLYSVRRFEEIAALLLVAAITLTLGGQIIFRYFFNDPLSWSEELVQFLIICLSFVAATAVLKRNEHYSVDMFVNMLPAGPKKIMTLIADVIQIALLVGLAYYSFRLALVYTGTSSVVLGIPDELKAYVMVYCFISMACHITARALRLSPSMEY